MIEISITQTCKGYSPKEDYYQYNRERLVFDNLKDAMEHLADDPIYGSCKRVKMYRDTETSTVEHIGYIYCYNSPPCCYNDNAKRNQDWVSFYDFERHVLGVG